MRGSAPRAGIEPGSPACQVKTCVDSRFPGGGRKRIMRRMAVLIQLTVAAASQDRFHRLEARVDEVMERAGGPPGGLMAHVVYPKGDGFRVADVWSREADGRQFFDEVLRPLLSELGLHAGETLVRPVWSFARP